jgi:glucose/arabinose dehydrogenase
MYRLLASIGLAVMLVLAVLSTYNFTHAQNTTETAAAEPSVKDTNLAVKKVTDGLSQPTTMAFFDKNKILVLEKNNGTVRMVENGKVQPEPLLDVAVANGDERGMLGIAVSRENETTTYVFLYFTESGGGVDGDDTQGVPPIGNRLYRYELQGDRLVNPKLLLDLPALPGPRHNGGPVAIGSDDNVYVIVGDVNGNRTRAQNIQNGSAADGTSGVLRIGKNGELPQPVIGTGILGKYYYAYGIRNSFGMTFDPETGRLWDTENGPRSGDEINLVEAGFNSGWRDVQGPASETDLAGLVIFNERSHYSNPEFTWAEPVAPTALAFLNSSRMGQVYENDMFVGDLLNGAIYRFDLNENRSALALEGALKDKMADKPEESAAAVFGSGFGGITDVKTGPDGNLYVVSFTDGAIYRIAPAGEPTEDKPDTAELTVKSADLSNNPITGMHAVIRSDSGQVLQEGYTPIMFTGNKGSTYTVTVSDFGSREFDRWDSKSASRTRTVTLTQDAMITAYYHIEPAASESRAGTIDRLIGNLDEIDCFGDKDQRKLDSAIGMLVKDALDEDQVKTDKLEKTLDRIIEDCLDDDGNGRGHGTGEPGRNGDDDDEEGEDDD